MPYRPTERTRAHAAAVRERIVAAALEQLAEGGYASAAVARVAERAGVATGTVYRHFPSKGDLFAEVFRRASQREVDVLAGIAAGSAAERLAAMVEAFVRRALAAPVRAYALIAEPVDPAVEAERLVFRRAYADAIAVLITRGIAAGELPDQDVQVSAAALVGAIGEALVGPLAADAADGDLGGDRGGADRTTAWLITFAQRSIGAVP
jgi:AcrR family transcriptional regulator